MKRAMKNTLYIIVGLILAISMLLNGCTTKEPTTQEILTNTITAMQKVDSYELDYAMVWRTEVVSGEETITGTYIENGERVIDIRDKESYWIMDVNMGSTLTGTRHYTVDIYLVGGWKYTKIDAAGWGGKWGQWEKVKTPAEYSQTPVAQLIAMMESSTKTTLLRTEKVNGVDCYVLEIVPDMAALYDWLMSQVYGEDPTRIYSYFTMSEIGKEFGLMKYWVAKNNYQMIKAEAEMTIEIDAEAAGISYLYESATIQMSMDMSFSNYDKAVNIKLPEEALDAEEVSAP